MLCGMAGFTKLGSIDQGVSMMAGQSVCEDREKIKKTQSHAMYRMCTVTSYYCSDW